jgi:hypothetical protein
VSSSEKDGVTVLEVSRLLVTNDNQDRRKQMEGKKKEESKKGKMKTRVEYINRIVLIVLIQLSWLGLTE